MRPSPAMVGVQHSGRSKKPSTRSLPSASRSRRLRALGSLAFHPLPRHSRSSLRPTSPPPWLRRGLCPSRCPLRWLSRVATPSSLESYAWISFLQAWILFDRICFFMYGSFQIRVTKPAIFSLTGKSRTKSCDKTCQEADTFGCYHQKGIIFLHILY